ncbi:MAG: YitT family protein [Paludibacteraceae bacterium]|nr:YitT family protein [Paludibacteraceae bacterium]
MQTTIIHEQTDPHGIITPGRYRMEVAMEYLGIFIALCPLAIMVNWIFIPHATVGGGLTGICSMIYYATRGMFPELFAQYGGAIPIWLTTLVINTVLLVIAGFTVGWKFCIRTIFGAFTLALWYRLIPIRETPIIDDPLLGCIVGGVLFGISLGLVLFCNGSSGGTDIIAMIVHHYRDISLGKVMIICDVLIILSAWFLPLPEGIDLEGQTIADYKFRRIMCGISMTVAYTASVDWFMSRIRQSVQFFIFSHKHDEIAEAISTTVHRGITLLDGKGWYSGEAITVVTVLARKHESGTILSLIQKIDPDAFVSCSNANGVFGSGFDKIKD